MRILFLTQYFTPEIGATQTRIHEFARACVAKGHQVTVVTEFPNHPHGRIPREYRWKLFTREEIDGFTVLRVWVWASPVKTTLRRLLFYGSFLVLSVLRGLFMRPRVDVVFATSPPLLAGLAGWIIAKIHHASFILDIRDLWPLAALALGELRQPILLRFAERLEHFLYRKADKITTVTRGFVRHIAACVGNSARIVLLPNGAQTDIFAPSAANSDQRRRLGIDNRFLITFAGNHGIAQGLDAILDAAVILRGRSDVMFSLIGDGPVKPRLVERARVLGLTNVLFLPSVPLSQITLYLTMSDALLVPLRNDPVFDTFVPSKLFDFLACARPVVLMVNGEAREILESSGGGIWVAPEDASGLVQAIAQFMAMSAEERQRMGERGRAYVLSRYTRAIQNRNLLELLERFKG